VYSPDGLKAEFLERSRLWDGRIQERALMVLSQQNRFISSFLMPLSRTPSVGTRQSSALKPVTDPIPGPNQVILIPTVELKFSGDANARERKIYPSHSRRQKGEHSIA